MIVLGTLNPHIINSDIGKALTAPMGRDLRKCVSTGTYRTATPVTLSPFGVLYRIQGGTESDSTMFDVYSHHLATLITAINDATTFVSSTTLRTHR